MIKLINSKTFTNNLEKLKNINITKSEKSKIRNYFFDHEERFKKFYTKCSNSVNKSEMNDKVVLSEYNHLKKIFDNISNEMSRLDQFQKDIKILDKKSKDLNIIFVVIFVLLIAIVFLLL